MPSFHYKLAVALCLTLLVSAPRAPAQVYQEFAYYDESEIPGIHLVTSQSDAFGFFFFPTLDISPIFTIERLRFWHIDFNEEIDPYRVLIVVRNTAAEHFYLLDVVEGLRTTCFNCWEEVEIDFSIADSSTPGWSYGVFVQPQGGISWSGEPRLRTDLEPSQPLVNLVIGYSDGIGFHWPRYTEDTGYGDFFMEIVVRYDDVTGTESSSYSVVKSLY